MWAIILSTRERLKLREVMGLTQGHIAIKWYQTQMSDYGDSNLALLLLLRFVTLGKSLNPSGLSFLTYKMKRLSKHSKVSPSSQSVTV